jgi:hypothetical protein
LDARDGDRRFFDGDATDSKSPSRSISLSALFFPAVVEGDPVSSRSITLPALFFPVVVEGDPLAPLLALPLDCHAIHLDLWGVFDGDPSGVAASVPCVEMKWIAWIKTTT